MALTFNGNASNYAVIVRSVTEMNELRPPNETGGGLIMWLLGAVVVLALAGGVAVLMGSIGG